MFKTDLAIKNWASKYQYNNENPIGTQERIAKEVASVEKNPKEWEEKFLNVLVKRDEDGKPIGLKNTFGGRITANIGTEYSGATLINCYINGPVSSANIKYERKIPGTDKIIPVDIHTEETPDNLANIMLTLLEQAETLKSEGGYGINFGFIRPRGTLIKSIGIKHPGVVHYMKIWDVVASVIVMGDNDGYKDDVKNYLEGLDDNIITCMKKQARKGAQMAVLPIWHPDIEEFIRAKQEEGNLTKFNISVLIDDVFMKAVLNDNFYNLHFNGKVYKKVKAKELYEVIVKSSHKRNEPGVLFYDTMQRNNPLSYLGPLTATNPSLKSDTLILTNYGMIEIKNLVNKEDLFVKNFRGEWKRASAFMSGKNKELYRIKFSDDSEILCTKEHKWPIVKRRRLKDNNGKRTLNERVMDYSSFEKIETQNLKKNQRVYFPFSDNPLYENIKCSHSYEDGILLGWLCGDGSVSNISDDGKNQFKINVGEKDGENVISFIEDKISKIVGDKCSFTRDHDSKCFKISASHENFREFMSDMDFVDKKRVPSSIFIGSTDYVKGYINGIFGADGYFDKKESRIVLTNRSEDFLLDIQKVLSFFGISSKILKPTSESSFPSKKDYKKKCTRFDLRLSKSNSIKFSKIFEIIVEHKNDELKKYKQTIYRGIKNNKEFKVIMSVEKTGMLEDVYDITVFDDTHTFICQGGIVTGNCGEIGGNTVTSTVCLLGSVNLTQYVKKNREFDWEQYKEDVKVFTRMLDNINDLTNAPLSQYVWAIKNIRQFGMGINGLGSTLYMMGIPYNSKEAEKFTEDVTWLKEEIAWRTSAQLAEEKGVFPAYNENFLKTEWFNKFTKISEETKELIRKNGVRNGKVSTNPPLGNSSVICDNVTNGIEPVFSQRYMRTYIVEEWPDGLNKYNVKKHLKKTKQGDATVWQGMFGEKHYLYEPHNRGLCLVEEVMDYGYGWVLDNYPEDIANEANYLVSSMNIDISDHIAIQSIVQSNCSQSVSKTVNLPEDYSFDDYKNLYIEAWKYGLNGFTSYREGSMESVLSAVEKNNGTREIIKKDIKLPEVFNNGPMHVIKREGMKFYMHFSYVPEDTRQIFPVSIWIHTNSFGEISEGNAAVKALISLLEKFEIDNDLIDSQKEKIKGNPGNQRVAKMISMCLRHNIPIVNIVHVLDKLEDVYVTDTIYAVKKFLSEHIEEGSKVIGAKCQSCKSSNVVYTGGCSLCQDCGASGCG